MTRTSKERDPETSILDAEAAERVVDRAGEKQKGVDEKGMMKARLSIRCRHGGASAVVLESSC